MIYRHGRGKLETLVYLIHQKVANPPVEKAELRELFCVYDKDGRGFVLVAKVKHLLTSVGPGDKLTDN